MLIFLNKTKNKMKADTVVLSGKTLYVFILIPLLLLFSSVSCQKIKLYGETRFLFTSYIEIKVLTSNSEKTKKDFANVFRSIELYGNQVDTFKKGSFVSELNKERSMAIPDELHDFIRINAEYVNKTKGYFNPFIGLLLQQWNYFKENSVPPSSKKIQTTLKNGFTFSFDKKTYEITLYPNVYADFGGSSQGYLVDKTYNLLKEMGYNHFLINCSGDIRVSGTNKGQLWKIGIKHPYKEGIIATTTLRPDEAIVTSGNYERYFIYDGKRYFHILNPSTGYPDSDIDSLTIKYSNTLEADILSTALFAMGKINAETFSRQHNLNIFMIWLEKNDTVQYSNNSDYSIIGD